MSFSNPDPKRYLAPSHLRVLAAVLQLWQEKGACGLREVQRKLGYGSPFGVANSLRVLKRHGLVKFEDNKFNTVVPQCYLILEKAV